MSDYKRRAELKLLEAVKRNDVTSVEEAIDQGANVDCPDDQDQFVCVVC